MGLEVMEQKKDTAYVASWTKRNLNNDFCTSANVDFCFRTR